MLLLQGLRVHCGVWSLNSRNDLIWSISTLHFTTSWSVGRVPYDPTIYLIVSSIAHNSISQSRLLYYQLLCIFHLCPIYCGRTNTWFCKIHKPFFTSILVSAFIPLIFALLIIAMIDLVPATNSKAALGLDIGLFHMRSFNRRSSISTNWRESWYKNFMRCSEDDLCVASNLRGLISTSVVAINNTSH